MRELLLLKMAVPHMKQNQKDGLKAKTLESIKVESRYTGIRIGIDGSASYNLEGRVSYGGLKFNEENYQNKKRIVENNSTIIEGIVGKEASPSSNVKVEASYGSIKLY